MPEEKKWWDTLPQDVQILLNRVQTAHRARRDLDEIRDLDLVRLRSRAHLDLNAIVDRVVLAEENLRDAVVTYEGCGGNNRKIDG